MSAQPGRAPTIGDHDARILVAVRYEHDSLSSKQTGWPERESSGDDYYCTLGPPEAGRLAKLDYIAAAGETREDNGRKKCE